MDTQQPTFFNVNIDLSISSIMYTRIPASAASPVAYVKVVLVLKIWNLCSTFRSIDIFS